ncbi:MAG TPA: TIM barrel protein [Candidatus Hydrogenedentes bacterium]|nr:TIM barrel protein [Candidatus Hydrogenedentota bacterium]
MVKLDVCLEGVFTDSPTEERISKIAACGYGVVEFWFHDAAYDGQDCDRAQPRDAASLRRTCEQAGVTVNNVVVNSPDGSFGGAPVLADDHTKCLERLEEVIEFANQIGCTKAITCSGNVAEHLSRSDMRGNLERALGDAAAIAEKKGFTLFLEPLNTHVDHPGYYLASSQEGAEVVRAINSPHLRLLFDVYHMQIMEGNIIATIEQNIEVIGHFHSAGVPGRGEHFDCELNYPEILRRITALGYDGCFGLEYFPAMEDHAASLKLVREYLEQT